MTPGRSAAREKRWVDLSPHTNAFLEANGVRLNYLDWGGSGPILILIPGAFDNAHCFDGLAPTLTDRFRVIAYSRRGHGKSPAKRPYDRHTLVEDLHGILNRLGIERAHLAGWSMGGVIEVTGMALAHPQRVGRIVYLDGALDLSGSRWARITSSYFAAHPVPKDVTGSLDAWWKNWSEKFPGTIHFHDYEAAVRDGVTLRPDGSVRPRMSDQVAQEIWTTVNTYRPEYSKIRVPALAIYAETFLDVDNGTPSQRADHRAWERKMKSWRVSCMSQVQRELAGVSITSVPGCHGDLFLRSKKEVADSMQRFLSASP